MSLPKDINPWSGQDLNMGPSTTDPDVLTTRLLCLPIWKLNSLTDKEMYTCQMSFFAWQTRTCVYDLFSRSKEKPFLLWSELVLLVFNSHLLLKSYASKFWWDINYLNSFEWLKRGYCCVLCFLLLQYIFSDWLK